MRVTEFTFRGLNFSPQLQVCLFLLFLSFYLINLTGYLGVIILIHMDSRLCTPCTFSSVIVFCGHVLLFGREPQDALRLLCEEESHLFLGLCFATGCFLWRLWPMAAVAPFETHCGILSPCPRDSESSWWWVPMSLGVCEPHDAHMMLFAFLSAAPCHPSLLL